MFDDLIKDDKNSDEKTRPGSLPVVNSFEAGQKPVKSSESLEKFNQQRTEKAKQSKVFEEKISELRVKGKKRGKRYSIIGIAASLIIFALVLYVGNKIVAQVDFFTAAVDEQEIENNFNSIIDPDNICDGNNCCLASIEKINKNNYQIATELENCNDGYSKNSLPCEGTLFWCEEELDNITSNSDIAIIESEIQEEAGQESSSPEIEAASSSLSELDSDGDGISDEDENLIYGTNPLLKDSDGDGYSDREEIEGGYNPLGEGSL